MRFTWNGLNPWIIFKGSVRYYLDWYAIWYRHFKYQTVYLDSKGIIMNDQVTKTTSQPLEPVVVTLEKNIEVKTIQTPDQTGKDAKKVDIEELFYKK